MPGFRHVVVFMGENRSFDNILGHLYNHSTVIPAHIYSGATDEIMCSPDPDPGETFPHVNTQLYETIDPAENEHAGKNGIASPFNTPDAKATHTMGGFVHDYLVNYRITAKGAEPTPDELAVIMGGFSPAMLPVLSTLAKEFATAGGRSG